MRILLLLLPLSSAFSAETLKVNASFSEDRTGILVEVEGPLPVRALATVRIVKDVWKEKEPLLLLEETLPCEAEGRIRAQLPVGPALQAPGRYRVQVSLEADGQYPEVLAAWKGAVPAPSEAVLSDAASPVALKALLDEEGSLAGALEQAGDFLDRLREFQAHTQGDQAALQAWKAWREKARGSIQAGLFHGRSMKDRILPGTNTAFGCFFLNDLLVFEAQKYGEMAGLPGVFTKKVLEGKMSQYRKALEPCLEGFRKESLAYRLDCIRAAAEEVSRELETQGKRSDKARWDRCRRKWDALLDLWPANLDRLPQGKELADLGKAFSAWMDASEPSVFIGDGKPEAGQPGALKSALNAQFEALSKTSQ